MPQMLDTFTMRPYPCETIAGNSARVISRTDINYLACARKPA